jgi:hypothetical protein
MDLFIESKVCGILEIFDCLKSNIDLIRSDLYFSINAKPRILQIALIFIYLGIFQKVIVKDNDKVNNH